MNNKRLALITLFTQPKSRVRAVAKIQRPGRRPGGRQGIGGDAQTLRRKLAQIEFSIAYRPRTVKAGIRLDDRVREIRYAAVTGDVLAAGIYSAGNRE